jgi:hypothetical protein
MEWNYISVPEMDGRQTPTHFLENYFVEVKIKNDHKSFLREN